MRMDTLASAAILFCVVTVHQQAQQGSDSTQAHVLQETAAQNTQNMAVNNLQETAVHMIPQMTMQRLQGEGDCEPS